MNSPNLMSVILVVILIVSGTFTGNFVGKVFDSLEDDRLIRVTTLISVLSGLFVWVLISSPMSLISMSVALLVLLSIKWLSKIFAWSFGCLAKLDTADSYCPGDMLARMGLFLGLMGSLVFGAISFEKFSQQEQILAVLAVIPGAVAVVCGFMTLAALCLTVWASFWTLFCTDFIDRKAAQIAAMGRGCNHNE